MVNDSTGTRSVALYPRVSTTEQAEGGTSVETQTEFLRDWAKLHGYEVYEIYSDPGYSGSTPDRPGFQRMLRDAEAGFFQLVVVTKLDRFMRDAREMLNAIEELKRYGVAFVAIIPAKPALANWSLRCWLVSLSGRGIGLESEQLRED